jgi:hypothetical protein
MWASGVMVGLAVRPTPWTSEPGGQGAAGAPPVGRVLRIDASDVEGAPRRVVTEWNCRGSRVSDGKPCRGRSSDFTAEVGWARTRPREPVGRLSGGFLSQRCGDFCDARL